MSIVKKTVLLFLAIASISPIRGRQKLPSFLKICSKSDPNLKKCFIESVEHLKPYLAKGIPEFDIPPCEPLEIPEVVIDQGTGPVSVYSCYKNVKVYGPSQFEIKNIRIDIDKGKLKIKLWLPRLNVVTNYSMNGQILMMPIKGSGLSTGNYTEIEAILSMKAKNIEKDDEIYYNIQDCSVDFKIGHAQLNFENLFDGNKELGDVMNMFLNDNWKTVTNEVKPILEDRLAEIFKKFANKIFHKYPISMLFPQ
ncbi:protein takeout-like [Sitophilus oryzae]|uniref:Protein takeout-like n=1 Tax=Sitophilus oryzae TaxID=7048 RepID=A0A6J2YRK0_SITOR|nr:protein takeout-like [Sitophilus oryzae]